MELPLRCLSLLPAALAIAIAASACASNGAETSQEGAAPATTSAAARPTGSFTISVEGRNLIGGCEGQTSSSAPVIVLESGDGLLPETLIPILDELTPEAFVCTYTRAGIGNSDPPPARPRPLDELVSDLAAVLTQAHVPPPYVLVGQSLGGDVVFRYAQEHPENVRGFVAMNPVVPYSQWIRAARRFMTRQGLRHVLRFYAGNNEEGVDFRSGTDSMLAGPLPEAIPYVVMFAGACGDNVKFCRMIVPPLVQVAKTLAEVGDGGRFVLVKGAGHEIYATHLDEVVTAIRKIAASP